jgi:hypothetical protein
MERPWAYGLRGVFETKAWFFIAPVYCPKDVAAATRNNEAGNEIRSGEINPPKIWQATHPGGLLSHDPGRFNLIVTSTPRGCASSAFAHTIKEKSCGFPLLPRRNSRSLVHFDNFSRRRCHCAAAHGRFARRGRVDAEQRIGRARTQIASKCKN